MTYDLEVIKPGLETTIQDWPGLKGGFKYGFNRSGPIDHYSFRMANLLVGNHPGAPGLEVQFIGPTIRFLSSQKFAVTGADMEASLDGNPLPLWETLSAEAGQILTLGSAIKGARSYIAFSGGLKANYFLGSYSTHTIAEAGGFDGKKLEKGNKITINPSSVIEKLTLPDKYQSMFSNNGQWIIEIVLGPSNDWLSEEGIELFINTDWIVSPRSNRMGIRLEGPSLKFSERAKNKAPEHGSHPSNCVDIGYPFGGINICGDTPVVLLNEGLTGGGFIIPFTVASCSLPKLAQARPHEIFKFKIISVEEAQNIRKNINTLCESKTLKS
tara:strand:+ start:70621 stop:71601 length:981 start_codon:yes stop_codon:yes gene_type:complete